jgi:hypothetical protein
MIEFILLIYGSASLAQKAKAHHYFKSYSSFNLIIDTGFSGDQYWGELCLEPLAPPLRKGPWHLRQTRE